MKLLLKILCFTSDFQARSVFLSRHKADPVKIESVAFYGKPDCDFLVFGSAKLMQAGWTGSGFRSPVTNGYSKSACSCDPRIKLVHFSSKICGKCSFGHDRAAAPEPPGFHLDCTDVPAVFSPLTLRNTMFCGRFNPDYN